MLKAMIFDMDGVLIDSQPIHFKADMEIISRYSGETVTQRYLERYAGTPNQIKWAAVKRDFKINKSEDELSLIHKDVLDGLLTQTPPPAVAGVRELLGRIKAAGYKTSVASSSIRSFVLKALSQANLTAYFDEFVCGDEVPNGKPAPDIFLKAAEILGARPFECVVFEDSANGVSASCAAGIKCIGYRNITSGNQDLSKADIVIDSFFDLEKIGTLIAM